jgi:hypothetical protein
MKHSRDSKDWAIYLLAVGIALGITFGLACLGAWAVQAIWPSVPFWPATILVWLALSLFNRSSNSAS